MRMKTLTLGKEHRFAFAKSRQILLTLKKVNGNLHDTPVIKPIKKIQGPKIVSKQLVVIKSNSRDGRSLGSEENDHSDVDVEVDGKLTIKMTQTPIETVKSLENAERHFILRNLDVFQSNYCQSCNKILYRCERCDESDTKSLGSPTLSRHDRFVPNILRNTKIVENIINNNYDATNFEISRKTEERNRKRNRKQVLEPLNNIHDCALRNYCQNNDNGYSHSLSSIGNDNSEESETETFPATTSNSENKDEEKSVERPRRKYRRHKKKKINKSSSLVPDQNVAEETETETLPVAEKSETETLPVAERSETETLPVAEKNETETLPVATSNVEDKDEEEAVGMEVQGSTGAEEAAKDDLYSAELNITCEHVEPPSPVKVELDVSIKKIFDEFEVADYRNYVASDDLNFYTDEMDKLLSSDVHGSSIGCDVDDNDVDDHRKPLKTLSRKNNNERKFVGMRSNAGYCNQGTVPAIKIRRVQRFSELDKICTRGSERFNVYQSPKMGLASCRYQDHYSSDDFQEFDQTLGGSWSSTDSASECEDEPTSLLPSPNLLLLKTDAVELSTPLTASAVVPHKVFDDESGSESGPGGLDSGANVTKRQLDSGPITHMDDANQTFGIGDDLDRSKPVESLDDLELFNGMMDNKILNFDFTALSSLDESCNSILADSNIEFDNERILNMFSVLPDLDIENTDDIEISKLLQLVTDSPLQPAMIKPLAELVSAKPDESTDKKPEKMISTGCDIDTEVSNVIEDQSNLLQDYEDHREIGWNDEGDFEWRDPQPVTAWSERDDLASSRSLETKDIDESVRCSTPLLRENENTKTSKRSKLRSLLMRPKIFIGSRPEASWAHSEFSCSRVNWIVQSSRVDAANSAVISDENPSSRETEHQKTEYTDDTQVNWSQVTEEAYMDARQTGNDSDILDFRTHAEVMIHRPMEFVSSPDQPSYGHQLNFGHGSLRKASTSGSPRFNSRNPKRDVRKKLVRRKQYTKQSPKAYYPCSFCKQICRSELAFRNHIDARHRSMSSKKYTCEKCSKGYSSGGAIQKHIEMHDNYTITCKVCGIHFAEKIDLKRHHNRSHLDWGFKCSYCGAKQATSNMLTRHVKKCRSTRSR